MRNLLINLLGKGTRYEVSHRLKAEHTNCFKFSLFQVLYSAKKKTFYYREYKFDRHAQVLVIIYFECYLSSMQYLEFHIASKILQFSKSVT